MSERQAANDELRTTFKGGAVLMTSTVYELPAGLRGRALYRMSQAQKFMDDEHSEGVFVWAGYCWYWYIGEFAGERSITLSLGDDWRGVKDVRALVTDPAV